MANISAYLDPARPHWSVTLDPEGSILPAPRELINIDNKVLVSGICCMVMHLLRRSAQYENVSWITCKQMYNTFLVKFSACVGMHSTARSLVRNVW